MESIILTNMLILGGIALVSAIILYLVSQKFHVLENPKIAQIEDLLPQANCGGCGKAGCHDFAGCCAGVDEAGFAELFCPVGGASVMMKIADILGYQATEKPQTVSVLRCNGSCQNAPAKIIYEGINSCRIANRISSGQNGCPDGCLKLGDCVKVCPFDALHIDKNTGLPVVDESKCTSCGACVRMCPRKLFEIRSKEPNGQRVYVACRNTQKGALARKNCKAACIACQKCVKINSQITIENNLSYIPDSVSAIQHGEELAKNCPTGAIIYVNPEIVSASPEITND